MSSTTPNSLSELVEELAEATRDSWKRHEEMRAIAETAIEGWRGELNRSRTLTWYLLFALGAFATDVLINHVFKHG